MTVSDIASVTQTAKSNSQTILTRLLEGHGFALTEAESKAFDLPQGFIVESFSPSKEAGEKSRTVIMDQLRNVVATAVESDKGILELHIYRSDGSVKFIRTVETLANNKPKVLLKEFYPPRGKGTPAPTLRETLNGIRVYERRKLADGGFESIRFKDDGINPVMIRRMGPKGGFLLIHYRMDENKIWFTTTPKGISGQMEHEYFAKDGSRVRRVMLDDSMLVTGFKPHGDFFYEQVWQVKENKYVLQHVDLRLADKIRRYLMRDDSAAVAVVFDLELDGSPFMQYDPSFVQEPDKRFLGEVFAEDDCTIPENAGSSF